MDVVSVDKGVDAFRTISEVAEDLVLPQHVLRFWETRFPQIKPMKRGGGRRYYRPDDVALVSAIKQLLYGEGYTIKGVQRLLKEQGVRALVAAALGGGHVAPDDDDPHGDPSDAAPHMPGDAPEVEKSVFMAQGAAYPGTDAASQDGPKLSSANVRRLQAALAELDECTRLLAAAKP